MKVADFRVQIVGGDFLQSEIGNLKSAIDVMKQT